jgi:hypothetical protein
MTKTIKNRTYRILYRKVYPVRLLANVIGYKKLDEGGPISVSSECWSQLKFFLSVKYLAQADWASIVVQCLKQGLIRSGRIVKTPMDISR